MRFARTVALVAMVGSLLAGSALADITTPAVLPLGQDWSNASLIVANDDWSGVPGILGIRGDDLTTGTGVDPQTLLGEPVTVVDVIANASNPGGLATGGVAEFGGLANPTIALQGSGTADAPHLVIAVTTSGRTQIRVSYLLRDLDDSADNAVQAVALQYRVGTTGVFTNLPAGFVADATEGPSLSGLATSVAVTLPVDAEGQPVVQLRIITSNAVGNDEWVGIDDLSITGVGCGDGVIQAGNSEVCDEGTANGGVSCCSATCQLIAAGQTCRGVGGVCDAAELCSGATAACPADGFTSGGVCRPAAGPCDVPESCDTSGPACPADAVAASTTICRPSNDVCDADDLCDGATTACPADGFAAAGLACRPATEPCDVLEVCSGTAATCPTDAFAAAGISCRAAADVCDLAETCSGGTATCPADASVAAGTVCRAAAGVCDLAEACTGGNAACPGDALVANGTACDDGSNCTLGTVCASGVCMGGTSAFSASPATLDFTDTAAGTSATGLGVSIVSGAAVALDFGPATSSDDTHFPVSGAVTGSVGAGATLLAATIGFAPSAAAAFTGTVTIPVTGCAAVTVAVTGMGAPPVDAGVPDAAPGTPDAGVADAAPAQPDAAAGQPDGGDVTGSDPGCGCRAGRRGQSPAAAALALLLLGAALLARRRR